jgi:hypothetical protein
VGKKKRKGKLNETTSADDDHGENDVFNLGDVDAAGSSVDPEYDSLTRNPRPGGEVFDSDPDSINTRRIVW